MLSNPGGGRSREDIRKGDINLLIFNNKYIKALPLCLYEAKLISDLLDCKNLLVWSWSGWGSCKGYSKGEELKVKMGKRLHF